MTGFVIRPKTTDVDGKVTSTWEIGHYAPPLTLGSMNSWVPLKSYTSPAECYEMVHYLNGGEWPNTRR